MAWRAAPLRRAQRIFDLSTVCYYLATHLIDGGQACDHTYAQTRAFFAKHAPHIDVDAYIALLGEAGAACDCEIGLNLCAKLGV